MQQVDDADGRRGKVRTVVTGSSSVAQNSRDTVVDLSSSGEEPRTNDETLGVSGKPKKSYGLNRGKKKKSPKGGEQLNSKVDGFVTDYSDSDIGTDGEEDDSEARKRSGTDATTTRVLGRARERSSGEEEIELRFMFLEAIMERARKADVEGVEEAMKGMALAGLDAGPRAYHGLVVAYTRSGDSEGAVRVYCLITHILAFCVRSLSFDVVCGLQIFR